MGILALSSVFVCCCFSPERLHFPALTLYFYRPSHPSRGFQEISDPEGQAKIGQKCVIVRSSYASIRPNLVNELFTGIVYLETGIVGGQISEN